MTFGSIHTLLSETGNVTRFIGRFFTEVFKPVYEYKEFLKQCFYVIKEAMELHKTKYKKQNNGIKNQQKWHAKHKMPKKAKLKQRIK